MRNGKPRVRDCIHTQKELIEILYGFDRLEIHYHPSSVNSCVRSAGSRNRDLFLEKNFYGFFEIFLNAGQVFLSLETVEAKSVVFDEEGVVYFSPPISSMSLLYSS